MNRKRPSSERREIEKQVDEQLHEKRPKTKSNPDAQRVGRVLDQLVAQLQRIRLQHPDIGIGDTSTDEQIAEVFDLLLRGKSVRPDSNIFALLPPEDAADDFEDWEDPSIRQATNDIVQSLVGAVARVKKAGGRVDSKDIVDTFYSKFHFGE